jgi:hypothetical protein
VIELKARRKTSAMTVGLAAAEPGAPARPTRYPSAGRLSREPLRQSAVTAKLCGGALLRSSGSFTLPTQLGSHRSNRPVSGARSGTS